MNHRLPLAAIVLLTVALGACECAPVVDVDPPPVDDAEPVAAEDFAAELKAAACASYRSCEDDRFRGGIFHLFLLPVGHSFNDDVPPRVVEEYRDEFHRLKESAEALTPPMLPDDDCEDFVGMVGAFMGVHPHQIEEAVESGAAEFDEQAAGQCIARIGATPSPCDAERTARGDDFNMQAYRAIANRHENEIKRHYQPCQQVFTGTKTEEAQCNYIYECAEGNCEWFTGEETGRCGPSRRGHWLVP